MGKLEVQARESLEKLINGKNIELDEKALQIQRLKLIYIVNKWNSRRSEDEIVEESLKIEQKANRLEKEKKELTEEKHELLTEQYIMRNNSLALARNIKNILGEDGLGINQENEIVYVGENVQKLLGYSEEELLGKGYNVLVSELNQRIIDSYLFLLKESQVEKERILKFKRKGKKRPISYYVGFENVFKNIVRGIIFNKKAGFFTGSKEEDTILVDYEYDRDVFDERLEEIKEEKNKNILIDLNRAMHFKNGTLEKISSIAKSRPENVQILNPSNENYKILLEYDVKKEQLVKSN
ncbi:PAS domain S-box protein [Candidatus Woesearchaeota archaeon]|nr:PAS domain S-box protein [Candidatus Woesearchaeota archaeon]